MEIPAWIYCSFWAITSFTFLHLGFHALERTGLSSSVSPVIMSFFKHFLAISCCHSSSYALIFRQHIRLAIHPRYVWVTFGAYLSAYHRSYMNITFAWGPLLFITFRFLAWLLSRSFPWIAIFYQRYGIVLPGIFISSEIFPWFFPAATAANFGLITCWFYGRPEQLACVGVHTALEASLFLVSSRDSEFYPVLVLFVAYLTSAYWAGLNGLDPYTCLSRQEDQSGDGSFLELLPVAARGREAFFSLTEASQGKLMEFGVGMVGTILFQYFFRLTSFGHVVAFLYVAVAWVANLALARGSGGGSGSGSGDLGIFNFLLGNVIVGCTVSQFGLRASTWIAYGVSVFLFGLRLKLKDFRVGPDMELDLIPVYWYKRFGRF